MHRARIHLKSPKHSGPLAPLLPKKGPTRRRRSPGRLEHIFKQQLRFTAFHHVFFEYCRNFHFDMTAVGYADAGQMLFKEHRPRRQQRRRAHTSAGISQQGSRCLHASQTSLRPSPGICNWLTDFQNVHWGYTFSSGFWTQAPDCHDIPNCKLL